MLNAQYGFRAPQNLVVPNGTGGWKSVGTLMNGVAGYMTWKDKKKQAEKMQAAQDNYYNALMKYLEGNKTPTNDNVVIDEQVIKGDNTPVATKDYAGRDEVQSWIDNELAQQQGPVNYDDLLKRMGGAEGASLFMQGYNSALPLLGGF